MAAFRRQGNLDVRRSRCPRTASYDPLRIRFALGHTHLNVACDQISTCTPMLQALLAFLGRPSAPAYLLLYQRFECPVVLRVYCCTS
jgi:hypothetical protein